MPNDENPKTCYTCQDVSMVSSIQACKPQPSGQSLSSEAVRKMALQFYWYQHPLQSSEQKTHLYNALLIRLLLFYGPLGDSIEGYLSLTGYSGAQMLREWDSYFLRFKKSSLVLIITSFVHVVLYLSISFKMVCHNQTDIHQYIKLHHAELDIE